MKLQSHHVLNKLYLGSVRCYFYKEFYFTVFLLLLAYSYSLKYFITNGIL